MKFQMSINPRLFVVILACLVLVGLVAACAPAPTPVPTAAPPTAAPKATEVPKATAAPPTQPPAAAPKELVIAEGSDITTLDPHQTSSRVNFSVYDMIYERLMTRDTSGKLVPQLALSYKNIDPLTWEFKLRQNVKFHNGEPFTAETVKCSFERLMNAELGLGLAASWKPVLDKVEAVDTSTVRIITKYPDPILPARTSGYGANIVECKYAAKAGKDGMAKASVGTGPYKFVEWKKDDRVVLEAYADHWNGKPSISRVVQRSIPVVGVRVAALKAGEVDIAVLMPPDQKKEVESISGGKFVAAPIAGMYMMSVSWQNPVLQDKRVRQAISYAIDRDSIIKDLFGGYASPLGGAILSTDFGYDASRPPLKQDLNKAKDLLKQANYAGQEIVIQSTSGSYLNDKQLAEALTAMLQNVGIKAKAEIVELALTQQFDRHEVEPKGLYLATPSSPYFDPDGNAWRLLQPKAFLDHGWRNSDWDALMMAGQKELDTTKRTDLYRKALYDMFLDENPWILLFQQQATYGVGPKVATFQVRPDQKIFPWEITLK